MYYSVQLIDEQTKETLADFPPPENVKFLPKNGDILDIEVSPNNIVIGEVTLVKHIWRILGDSSCNKPNACKIIVFVRTNGFIKNKE